MNHRSLILLAALVCLLACSSGRPPGTVNADSAPAWPPEEPRVRFDGTVETIRDLGRSAFFKRLAGQTPAPIFDRPYGVAWSGDDLLVSDPAAGTVLELTAKGKVIRTRPGLLVGPTGIAACFDGVVVADSRGGRVGLLNDKLALVRWLAEDLERPTGVACVAGEAAVVETAAHRIVMLSPDGSRRVLGRRGTAEGEFNFPAAITSTGDTLWVGDTLNFRIQEIDAATGQVSASFGALGDAAGETPRIKGLAFDAQGRLWVSDAHLDLIALFDASGVFLMDLGGPGQADGELSFPAGIAVHPDGRVAVADSLNRRIQFFRVIDDDTVSDGEGR